MRKDAEYLKHADDARQKAADATSAEDKSSWLRLAESWLRMIRQPDKAKSDKFDDAEAAQGTHQKKSDSEH